MGNTLKTADLFAGIGGIRKGFEKAGFQTLYAADIDPHCKLTYDANFKNAQLGLQPVESIDPSHMPDFDILLAGFPCQPFSIAGLKRGFSDKGRGDLFFDIIKIIHAKKPRAVFLENVKNLKTHDQGKTFVVIKENLERHGYKTKVAILNSAEYGNVPQSRERIYIVGFMEDAAYDAFEFPQKKILTKHIPDILEDDVPENYYYRKGWLYDRIKKEWMEKGVIYQWRRVYLREIKSGLCSTLTANMGMGGHNVPLVKDAKGMRRLTPRECARLQGFPEGFKLPKTIVDSKLYKQIGNSVTVSVVERIAKNIRKALEASPRAIPKKYGRHILKEKAQRDNVSHKVPEYVA